MTDSTDNARGPERIWMDPDIKFPECEKQYGCDVEYIRADLAAPSPDVLADARVVVLVDAAIIALDDLDEWLAISESLIRAGFNMDDTQARADKLRAALASITDTGETT